MKEKKTDTNDDCKITMAIRYHVSCLIDDNDDNADIHRSCIRIYQNYLLNLQKHK